ncbi:hypothetical protein CPB86DRAFT_783519 [Serendipita vermifera]|nr:hypothetical protein CPB86DRAFT_783519 [Serendipita vermifera]
MSAIDRAPVEIWTLILHYVCAAPFSPFLDLGHNHLDTSVLANEMIFEAEYQISQQYQDFEDLLVNIRLVCRPWASIVDSLSRRYIYTDMKKVTYPRLYTKNLPTVETIHIVDTDLRTHCLCKKEDKQCTWYRCKLRNGIASRQYEKWWRKDDESLRVTLRNVKVLILVVDFEPEKIMNAASNIRALSMNISSNVSRLTALPARNMVHLTHLELRWINCDPFFEAYFAGSINFPSIRYLVLDQMTRRTWIPPPLIPVHSQAVSSFPRLKTLILKGRIHDTIKDMIKLFMKDCGRTVSEFVERPDHYPKLPTIFPTLANHFPKLHLYGTSLAGLLAAPITSQEGTDIPYLMPYIPSGTSFTLLIYNFSELLTHPDQFIELWSTILASWKLTDIIIDGTWGSFEEKWMGMKDEARLSSFSSLAIAVSLLSGNSISLCDRRGISIKEWIASVSSLVPPVE